MNKNIVPDNFTVSMVIVDSFPVIFFSGTAILVGVMLKNPVFILGAIISALSGILKVLSMQGENDKVLHKNIADKCDANLPADYMKVIINGDNHSQFGDYGFQAKDGEATITKEEQWEEIKNNIQIFVTK